MLRRCDGYVASSECFYCFTNKYHPQGLYLCMHCDFCTCLEHAEIHYKKTGHENYLNLRYVLRDKQHEISVNDKVNMLLYGKDEEVVVVETKIYKLPGYQPVETVSDAMTDCYLFMLDAEEDPDRFLLQKKPELPQNRTMYEAMATGFFCEHLPEILTSPPSSSAPGDGLRSTKCMKCDISTNTWLCLTCGHVGCGRKQPYGEISGNGHALDHYAFTNCAHCVSINLTSLSSKTCEAYCYKCDQSVDDVLSVPDMRVMLKNYLSSRFGFNVASLMDREDGSGLTIHQQMQKIQSTAEAYNLSKASSEQQISLNGILSGFRNTGNTCYANSVISCLRACGIFPRNTRELRAEATAHYLSCSISDPVHCQLCQLYRLNSAGFRIVNYTNEEIEARGYTLNDLPRFVVYSDPHLSPLIRLFTPQLVTDENIGRQQDAHEYLEYLADFFTNRSDVSINKLLLPASRRELRCTACKGHVFKPESQRHHCLFLSCSLFDTIIGCEVGPEVSLAKALRNELIGTIGAVDGLHCPLCGVVNKPNELPVVLLSTSYLVKDETDMPEILLVVANRQYYNRDTMSPCKLSTRLIDAEQIDGRFLVSLRAEGTEEEANTRAWEQAIEASQVSKVKAADPLSAHGTSETYSEQVKILMDMEIASREVCRRALELCNGGTQAAINMILNNEVTDALMDAEPVPEPAPLRHPTEPLETLQRDREVDNRMNNAGVLEAARDDMKLNYSLIAFVVHRGADLTSGHYLSYIRMSTFTKEDASMMLGDTPFNYESDWIVLNDDEISLTSEPPTQIGYLYFYRKGV